MSKLTDKTWWKDAARRALYTAIALAIPYIAAVQLADVPWVMVASAAAVGAIASLATSLFGLPESNGVDLPWWLAALERVVKTFAQSIAAGLVGATFLTDVDWPLVLQAALGAAFISLLRLILATLPNDPTPVIVMAEANDGTWQATPEAPVAHPETVGVDVEQVADLSAQERYPLRRDLKGD